MSDPYPSARRSMRDMADDGPDAVLGGPPFPGVTFAGAVSLGGNCETAHWLRVHGRHGVRGPFDWLVTPLDALPAVLADDGARLGTVFALANAGTSVRCRAYGLLYHHEFPRGAGDAVVFDADTLAACRSKMAHKWASLGAACERAVAAGLPMLFLRLWGGTDLAWDRIGSGKAELRAGDLNALAAALVGRFPGLDFRLLVLLPVPAPGPSGGASAPAGSLDPRVAVRSLARGCDRAWAVDGATWGRLLASLRFRDPPATAALGETLHWSGEPDAAPTPPSPAREALASWPDAMAAGPARLNERIGFPIVACLSMDKTGSVAIAAALRDAGHRQVLNCRSADGRTRASRERSRGADAVASARDEAGLAARLAASQDDAAVVTCVRDPIARILSAYFQQASIQWARHGIELALSREAIVEWYERSTPADHQERWFDDNLRSVLGFDFRLHPFDRELGSIRFEAPRIRLLCLRCEDPPSRKAAELGWLMRQDAIALSHLNVTADKYHGRTYGAVVSSFTAPEAWTESLYEGEVTRHFYTATEREAFRARWSRR